MPQCDNLAALPCNAGEQDRRFVCLCTGAGKEALLQFTRRDLRKLLRQRHDGFVGVQCGGVLKAVELLLDSGCDLRIAMPHTDGNDSPEEIEILIAFDVPQVLHRRTLGNERLLIIRGDCRPEVFIVLSQNFSA